MGITGICLSSGHTSSICHSLISRTKIRLNRGFHLRRSQFNVLQWKYMTGTRVTFQSIMNLKMISIKRNNLILCLSADVTYLRLKRKRRKLQGRTSYCQSSLIQARTSWSLEKVYLWTCQSPNSSAKPMII